MSNDSEKQLEIRPLALGPDGIPVPATLQPAPSFVSRVSPTATPDTLVCTVGPCEHYCDVLLSAQESNRPEEKTLRRFCKALATSSELMELTEAQVFACGCYSPKVSAESRAREEKNKADLEEARRIIGARK